MPFAHDHSTRVVDPLRSCAAKKQYPTRKCAKDAATRLTVRFKTKHRSYPCSRCGMYHLTTH